ncbi:cell division protein ZapA [Thalassotalea fusca]
MKPHNVSIEVANRRLKVACPQGQESALLLAAEELNQRLSLDKKNQNSVKTPEQAMLMTALNLANDLIQAKKAHKAELIEMQSKIDLLQSTIEQALQEKSSKQA